MKEKIPELISAFQSRKVLVVGDAILDTYTKGVTEKICREAPVLILNVKEHDHQCGGAANTAINVAALGAQVYLLSITGNDTHAQLLMRILKKYRVQTGYMVPARGRATISKQRLMASASILLRVDEGTVGPIPPTAEKMLSEHFRELAGDMDTIIFSDYGYGTISDAFISQAAAFLPEMSIPVIVDAKDPARFKPLQPWAVKPNYREAQLLLQVPAMEGKARIGQMMDQGPALSQCTGARFITVTMDTDGAMLFEKDTTPFHIPAVMQDNALTIGAGDTFTAALSLGLACGADGKTAMEIAAAAAAVVVQKNGTAVCTRSELQSRFTADIKYIPDLKNLQRIVKDLREQGKKIVFTNGCFDILHKGHIAMLQQARRLGDVLIVGLNTDDSIRKLKGPGRPINTLQDRISVLSGLQGVDIITSFSATSPVELLRALHPDVFVKGGTWSEQSIPEIELLKQLGCAVKIIPNAGSHSTTDIIRKILSITEKEGGINKVR